MIDSDGEGQKSSHPLVAPLTSDDDPCKIPGLVGHLPDDLLAAGYDPDESDRELELTSRDADRIRILKRLAAASGSEILLKTIVSEAIKGQPVGQCERFDGSDADYQFARRFVDDLENRDDPLVRKTTTNGFTTLEATLSLLSLIQEGITQTAGLKSDVVKNREWCEDLLKTLKSVDDRHASLLEDNFTRYLDRIDDYRLCFDLHRQTGRGLSTEQFTKSYKTRFNDSGRIRKQFARFKDALESQHNADNAVLCTLTTDPGTFSDSSRPDPRSLWDMISSINSNFNKLLSYLSSDPSTQLDTRSENVADWRPGLEGEVTGRPRFRPEYIKALEFTADGKPHLHVLFFDVPTRESDGMPWLCDNGELEKKWKDYGQGQIVDCYPLTFDDDLGDDFATDAGFVDWYRHGDHDLTEAEANQRARGHKRIEFHDLDDDGETMQKTAGQYLGKYLSATFGKLLEETENLDKTSEGSYTDKVATWKLALYWATETRFWSCSRSIQERIKLRDHFDSPNVREAVRDLTKDTLERVCPVDDDAHLEAGDHPDVEHTLPDPLDALTWVEFLGAYRYDDIPGSRVSASRDLEPVEDRVQFDPGPDLEADKPPPMAAELGG